MMLLVVLVCEALADTITLDSGAAIEGTLTHYEIHGACNIHVEAGDFAGADVVLPCSRLVRMERVVVVGPLPDDSSLVAPEIPAEEVQAVEEMLAPVVGMAAMTEGEDLAEANVGAEPEAAPELEAAPEEPFPPAPAPEEQVPVAAVSPQEPPPAEEAKALEATPEEPPPAEAEAQAPEAAPEKKGPLSKLTWPKIRLD
jgi:hypothetical protein